MCKRVGWNSDKITATLMAAAQLSFLAPAVIVIILFAAAVGKKRPIIATHDAKFHCDEVTACFMLQQLDRFKRHQIVRTRDPSHFSQAEVVVDVGGQLDLESLRFDHHQRGFNQTIHHYHPTLRTTNPTSPPRLSSAGLVYAVFGKDVITKVLFKGHSSYNELSGDEQRTIDWVFENVYTTFIEEMDAIDNGVEAVSGEKLVHNYRVETGIGHRVSKLNPGPLVSQATVMTRFERAMDMVGAELISTIKRYGIAMQMEQGLGKSIAKRREFDSSGEIVLVDAKTLGRRWKTTFANLEGELGIEGEIKYLVHKEKQSTNWRVVAVPVHPSSYKSRLPLRKEWRGLSDEKLQQVSGIRDAIFVHPRGHTGGAKSLEGIKEMCLKSLEAPAAVEGVERPTIATHDARFQCDEVTACFLLKQLDRFKDHKIIRTRDPLMLARAEIMLDVGGRLDPKSLKFDHHQRGFNQTIHHYHPRLRTTNPTSPPLLSSAGLVYALFGKDIITKVLKERPSYNELSSEEKKFIDWAFESLYTDFIEEIDAMDNGLEPVSGENVVYNYRIQTGIGHRVSRLNPSLIVSDESAMRRFERAMHLVGEELILTIKHYGSVLPESQELRESIVRRNEFDPSGQMVLVDRKTIGGQWRKALGNLESELGIGGEIKYMIYQRERWPGWRVLAVTIDPGSFKSRLPLKEEWRGLRNEELRKASGIEDAIFVHPIGFQGGAKSLEGVKRMCRKSLEDAALAA